MKAIEGRKKKKKKTKKQVWALEVSIRIYLCSYRLCLLAMAQCA